MTETTYAFLDVQATISGPGGSFSLGSGSGAAEEGITIEREGDKDTMQIGADGRGMHSLHASKAGKATVRLLMTSKTNALLSAMYASQTTSSALHGQNVITITNPVTGDTTTIHGAAFAKFPTLTYATNGQMREWVFNAIKIDSQLGSGSPALV